MTHLWQKKLSNDAGVVFTVPCDPAFRPIDMHEPLIILFVFPLTFVQSYQGPRVLKELTVSLKWREPSIEVSSYGGRDEMTQGNFMS